MRITAIDHRTKTCSGERVNDLFPIMNVICGIASMLLQFMNDCPTGLGSFSHSFYRKGEKKNKGKACETLIGKVELLNAQPEITSISPS